LAHLVVTIDGPAASGKSTAARLLAERIGAGFLDTGAMYRAVALAAIQAGGRGLSRVLEKTAFEFSPEPGGMIVRIDGREVTSEIRTPEVTRKVREIACLPSVRERLVRMQRRFAAGCDRIVTEGRDQGTVVFPGADVKFYLTAAASERARRRGVELKAAGMEADLERLRTEIAARDSADAGRAVGPLVIAAGAVIVDTTGMTVEQVVDKLVEHTRLRCSEKL